MADHTGEPHVFEHLLEHSENPGRCCPYCREELPLEDVRYWWEDPKWYDYWVICGPCAAEHGLEVEGLRWHPDEGYLDE